MVWIDELFEELLVSIRLDKNNQATSNRIHLNHSHVLYQLLKLAQLKRWISLLISEIERLAYAYGLEIGILDDMTAAEIPSWKGFIIIWAYCISIWFQHCKVSRRFKGARSEHHLGNLVKHSIYLHRWVNAQILQHTLCELATTWASLRKSHD